MPEFYTYKKDADAAARAGQTVKFTTGKGYYISGTATPPKQTSDAASGGGYGTASKQPTPAVAPPTRSDAASGGGYGTTPQTKQPAPPQLSPGTTTSTPVDRPTTPASPSTKPAAPIAPISDAASSGGYGSRYYTYRKDADAALKPGQKVGFTTGKGYYLYYPTETKTPATTTTPTTTPTTPKSPTPPTIPTVPTTPTNGGAGGGTGGSHRRRRRLAAAGPGLPPKGPNARVPPWALAVSPRGIQVMLSWEKFRPNVYADSNGNATIGWGHLIHYGPPTDADRKQWGTMTKSEADALFAKDSAFAVNAVQALVKQPLNQHQFDALVDFVFNVGTANFQSSTLLRDLNAGRLNRVPDDLRMWVVGGPGLKTRRDDEVALFTHGAYIYHD